MQFSNSFFENLKIRQNIIFSMYFNGVIVGQKWVLEKIKFYCRQLKIYFQRATDMMNTNLISNTSYETPFWKRRLFYLKIACFLQKVWDFGRLLTYTYVMVSIHVPCISDTLWRNRHLFQTSFGISKSLIFYWNCNFWKIERYDTFYKKARLLTWQYVITIAQKLTQKGAFYKP